MSSTNKRSVRRINGVKVNWEFKVTGDESEKIDLQIYTSAQDMYMSIHEALQYLRTTLKYTELSKDEETRLEEIRRILMEADVDF